MILLRNKSRILYNNTLYLAALYDNTRVGSFILDSDYILNEIIYGSILNVAIAGANANFIKMLIKYG